MTKNLMCMALAALMGTTALTAQTNDTKPAHKTVFAKDGLGSHWFIELGDYATFLQGGTNNNAAFGDRLSYVNPTLSVGRWHRPYFATRINLQGGQFKEFVYNGPLATQGKHTYLNGTLDFMFDVVNYFAPYKENRFFHIIPFVGIGASNIFESDYAGTKDSKDRHAAIGQAGLQLKFRLAKCVDLNLEGKMAASYFSLPSYAEGSEMRGGYLGSLGASLTFHLGKKAFTPIVPQDEALVKNLNDQLNALRAENAELSKRPVDCPEVEAPQVAGVAVGNVVYFRLNSAVVDANQMINIRNIAEYAKNNTETITLVGHADRQTGTPEYNYKLSERRAEAVKKILVERFGISADRIKTSWEGDRVQPYAENVWNRVVIMNAE
ncbi:MAG: OmpA family protein [Porphyromonas sp.]|nr:OmpA family protein [Porphyromonas sp.]